MQNLNFIKRLSGFSLIEVLVVVAVIGLLSAIAVPNYQAYIQKSRRQDAEAALMQLRQVMEKFYGNRFTYVGAASGAEGVSGAPLIFPASTPLVSGSNVFYQLRIVSSSTSDYWLSAIPFGEQANDECGTLFLHSSGLRGSGDDSSGTSCWNGAGNNNFPP